MKWRGRRQSKNVEDRRSPVNYRKQKLPGILKANSLEDLKAEAKKRRNTFTKKYSTEVARDKIGKTSKIRVKSHSRTTKGKGNTSVKSHSRRTKK